MQMPCVSRAIDAGTIERRPLLDITILAPYTRIKPFPDDATENETLTAKEYRTLVPTTIKELHQTNVNVRSILGDNLPAQVTALADWNSWLCLKRGNQPFLHSIKYSPCICHCVQLVGADVMTGSWMADFESILQEMITVANFWEVHQITKSRCLQSVKVRWLS
jgi:hypothetical protein